MALVVVLGTSLLLLLVGGGVGADSPNQPVHSIKQGRQKSSVSSHVGLCEALQYPCLIGTVLPHPSACQLYLQCVFPGVGQVGVSNNWIVRACSQGTMFDRRQLFCVLPSGVECAKKCKNNGTIPGLSGKEVTQDSNVEQSPRPKPQEKTFGEQALPNGERPEGRPSIPLSETLYLPEQLKSELPPQDYNTMSNSPGNAQGRGAAQGGEAAQREGYNPVYRSTDHSQESRGPREALAPGQQHYPQHRPGDHSHESGLREEYAEQIEPRKGRFPEYRPTDYETDDHKGAWKEKQYPEYVPDGNPDALIDRHKSGVQGDHHSDFRFADNSHKHLDTKEGASNDRGGFDTDLFKPRASRDAQDRLRYGSSPPGQQTAAQDATGRDVEAKQAPENQGSPEQFWWDALNLLYGQEAKAKADVAGGRDRLEGERGIDARPKSRNWRRKDQTATNWNNNGNDFPPPRSRNRKEPKAANWELPRDRNLNRQNPPMRNEEGPPRRGGSNRENRPQKRRDEVDPPWKTREIFPVFPAPTQAPAIQQQQQQSPYPVRLAIPTPLPIPEPSTLGGTKPQGPASTPRSSGRDAARSSRFPMGYRAKTRDVTKSAKPEKTEYDRRKTPTTRSVFGDHVTQPGATTEAPSTIMPWGTFYKLLRKYALGPGDAAPGPRDGAANIRLGPTTISTIDEQREGKGSKAGISDSDGGDSGRVTSPRIPYLGAKMDKNYRMGHSLSESINGRNREGEHVVRYGDNRGTSIQQGKSDNRNTQSRQGHGAIPSHAVTDVRPLGTSAKETALPKARGIDPETIGGRSMSGVPGPVGSVWTNPKQDYDVSSQEGSSEYSIEEPPIREAGTIGGELLRSIEGMFPDLDLSDLDAAELERFLNRQISSAEMVDTATIDTTDTTSTTERATTTTAPTIAPAPVGTTRANSSEKAKLPSQQQRTVRIPLSGLTDQRLQQEFRGPSSQSSAAEAASRVRTLYRYLQRRLRLQGYRPVLKIAELPVTTSTTTATTELATKRQVQKAESTTTRVSEQDLWRSLVEESQAATATLPPSTTQHSTSTQTTKTHTTLSASTARPTTTTPLTTESDITQHKTKLSQPAEELIETGRHYKEQWYKDSKDAPTHGIKEDDLKQSGVEHSFNRGTFLSENAPKDSRITEGTIASDTSTDTTSNANPSTRPNIKDDKKSIKKASEFFEANTEEDLPGERDGTEAKDPRDKDVFHLPQTTVSHTPSTQGVILEYGHVAMPTKHEGDSRSLEMVYSVSKEQSGGRGNYQNSNQTLHREGNYTAKVPGGNPYQNASPGGDSPSERDSPSAKDSQSERESQPKRDSLTANTEASPDGDSPKPLIIPGAMPPPGGWRKVEHKMLLGMEGVREHLGEGLGEGRGEGLGEGMRGHLGEGMREHLGKGMREPVGEGMGEHLGHGLDGAVREHPGEGPGDGVREGLGKDLSNELKDSPGDSMRDSHLFEHIHPEMAPSYEQVDGVDYSSSAERGNRTDKASVTSTDTTTATTSRTKSTPVGNAGAEHTIGDNRDGYQPSEMAKAGSTSTLPITTPTSPPVITMDMGTYHTNTERRPGFTNLREELSSKDHTAIGATDLPHTNPVTRPTGSEQASKERVNSVDSPKLIITLPVSSTTVIYDTTSTKLATTSPVTPSTHEDGPKVPLTPKQGVNRTLSVLHVDTPSQVNVSGDAGEGQQGTTDRTADTTTSVTMKSEGVSVGLIVGISFVVLLLIAIAMLPLIFCAIYKKDRKRMNDNYMDRTDITTLASYGTNNRNYTSTTTLASVGSTRPLIRTPSWINKMMLFKKLNRKSVSDHCLVNMYHERQHPSTEDLYGSHGNQSCHLATKYASLSTERAASRKKRKSRESSSRMDDVISDFTDESVFYLKRPKVKTKQYTPSVV